MFKRNLAKIVIFGIILTFFLGCTATKTTAVTEVQRVLPKFDYAPKQLEKVGSAKITIALVNPQFGDKMLTMNPFEDMRKSMANDFEELLTAKGFKIRGPFNQVGEMLYNDKQNSDFIMLVDIDLNFKNIERKGLSNTTLLGALSGDKSSNYYTFSGEGTFSCNLALTATSSNFGEKLWKKNITLPPLPFKYEDKTHWSTSNVSLYDEVLKDNSVYNAIAKVLESQYDAILDLVEKQIDVQEMKSVAKEAHKVDGKK